MPVCVRQKTKPLSSLLSTKSLLNYNAPPIWHALAIAVLFVPFVFVLVLPGKLFVSHHLQDIFVPLGGMWHVINGHVAHRDFYTSIGAFLNFPLVMAANIFGVSAVNIIHANVIVVVALAVVAFPIVRKRLVLSTSVLFYSIVIFTILSPRQIGKFLDAINFLAPYNRWSWSIVSLIVLLVFVPPRSRLSRLSNVYEGVVAGGLLTILLYIKLTYFAVGVAAMFVALLLRYLRPGAFGIGMLVLVASVAALEMASPTFSNYLADSQLRVGRQGYGSSCGSRK